MHKCNVCERTNSRQLALNPENYYNGSFLPDPKQDGVICDECFEIINETLYEMELDDEFSKDS